MNFFDDRETKLLAICRRLEESGDTEAFKEMRKLIRERRSKGFHAPLNIKHEELIDLQQCYLKIAYLATEAGMRAGSVNAGYLTNQIDAQLARIAVLSGHRDRLVDHMFLDGIGNLVDEQKERGGLRLRYKPKPSAVETKPELAKS